MVPYTEYERVLIARKEYDSDIIVNSEIRIENGANDLLIGTVEAIHENTESYTNTGFYAIEVLEPDGDVTLLFRGSAVIY